MEIEDLNTIIIYGGDLPTISAAAKTATTAITATIHLIVPYVPHKLGGITKVGGQNYLDYRLTAYPLRYFRG